MLAGWHARKLSAKLDLALRQPVIGVSGCTARERSAKEDCHPETKRLPETATLAIWPLSAVWLLLHRSFNSPLICQSYQNVNYRPTPNILFPPSRKMNAVPRNTQQSAPANRASRDECSLSLSWGAFFLALHLAAQMANVAVETWLPGTKQTVIKVAICWLRRPWCHPGNAIFASHGHRHDSIFV